MRQNIKILATAMIPAAAFAVDANAALIGPGGLAQGFFTSPDDRPDLAGEVVASQTIPLTLEDDLGHSIYTLNILNRVIRSSTDGSLSFSYRVLNDAAATIGIDRVEGGSFNGYSADVASLLDGNGQSSPTMALRAHDGAMITFDFDDSASRIAAGASSFDFLVKTDATGFDRSGSIAIVAFTTAGTQAGSDPIVAGAASTHGFQPFANAVIPLPAAAIVGIPAAVAVALFTARPRRRAARST